jgi:hypothetical protein
MPDHNFRGLSSLLIYIMLKEVSGSPARFYCSFFLKVGVIWRDFVSFAENNGIRMKVRYATLPLFLFLSMILSFDVAAQAWDFIKEKDGIRIYTRKENKSDLKSFRGVADLHTEMSKVTALLGNPKSTEWWTKDVSEVKILAYEPEKLIQYYLVYDVPWPFTDRDLVVESIITADPGTGKETILATPISNLIPENPERVRIKNYWQKWTVQQQGKGVVRVVLEGYVDPAGNVPSWLYNMVITETPLKVIREVKRRVETRTSS